MNLLPKQESKQGRLAFTLIDVMMGMGVLGVVLLSLFASFTFGFTSIKLFREELKATQILQEKTEVVRLYNWNQINTPKFVPLAEKITNGGFYRVEFSVKPVTITNTSYSDYLRQIDITVSWTNNNTKRTRSTRTFVSEFGLQNYVFSYE